MRSSIMVDAAGTQGAVAGGQNVMVKTRMEIVNNVLLFVVWRTAAFCVRFARGRRKVKFACQKELMKQRHIVGLRATITDQTEVWARC